MKLLTAPLTGQPDDQTKFTWNSWLLLENVYCNIKSASFTVQCTVCTEYYYAFPVIPHASIQYDGNARASVAYMQSNSSIHYNFFEVETGMDTLVAIISKAIKQMLQTYGAIHSTRCHLATRIVSYADSLWPVLAFVCVCVGHFKFVLVCRISFISFITMFVFWNDQNERRLLYFSRSRSHLLGNHAQLEHIILEAVPLHRGNIHRPTVIITLMHFIQFNIVECIIQNIWA